MKNKNGNSSPIRSDSRSRSDSRNRSYGKSGNNRYDAGGNRSWSRHSHFQSTSLDWSRRKYNSNSHHYHHHHYQNGGRLNWRNQQDHQRQQALQALKILNSFDQDQQISQYQNEPISSHNVCDKNNPTTSRSQTSRSKEYSKVSEENPSNRSRCNSRVDSNRSTNHSRHDIQTKSVKAKVVEKNESDVVKQSNENVNIKTEKDLNSTSCDEIYRKPEIRLSLIPLSLLLKEEPSDLVLEKHFEQLKKQFEIAEKAKQIGRIERTQLPPQIQDPEALSKKLVNRVITMDRDSIKNVINNPGSKFDAALKLRARKRLREEIRRQLKQLNLSATSEGSGANIFEPDDFVDSAQIPEAVINEIRKTFGLQFLEEAGVTTNENANTEVDSSEPLPDIVEDAIQKTSDEKEGSSEEKPKTDLMTRLKNLESIKSNRSKVTEKSSADTEVCIIKSSTTEEIVAINSSSDSSDNSDSSDSDSDSSTSSSSSTCSTNLVQKNRKKKKALEENVVSSFKTLILPQLTSQQRRCFEKKSTNGTLESLTYIYDICLNKMSKEAAIGNYHKRVLKKNLKSSNNEEALQFLMKNIKELFEQGKINRRKKIDYQKNAAPSKKHCGKALQKQQSKSPQKLSEENQQILSNAANEISGLKPSNDNHPPYHDTAAHPQKHITKEKVPTENKTAHSAVGGASNQPLSVEGNKAERSAFGSDCNKTSGEAPKCLSTSFPHSNSNDDSDNRSGNKLSNSTDIRPSSPAFLNNRKFELLHAIESSGPESTDNEHRPRSWKSPGEKKCLEPLSPSTDTPNEVLETSFDHLSNQSQSNNLLSDVSNVNLSSTFNISQAENLRLLALIQQNKISEAVLNNLKEIDFKLMELHKRKMYVEEMILKLQKDKMAIDLNTMQLQNEKFLIISTAAAQSNLRINSGASLFSQSVKNEPFEISYTKCSAKNKKKKVTSSRPPFSTPFSEKLKNRKKRCQRDILLEDTANTLCNDNIVLTDLIRHSSPDEISENVDNIFQRKKRKTTKRLDADISKSSKENKCWTSSTPPKDESIKDCEESIANDLSWPIKANNQVPSITNEETPSDCSQEESILESEESHCNNFLENLSNSDVPNGCFEGFKLPISQIRHTGDFIFAASEDGHVYKFSWKTKQLLSKFVKHTEAVTQILIDSSEYVYTTSLDGFMKKTSVENFGLEIQSVNTQEPLQTIELQWNTAFIGSRWGNVFTYNVKKNKLADTLLCSVGSSIMALKAAKEGARRILIVSSKGNQINLRDATSGLLLRTIEVPPNVNIYSILLNESLLYCGSSKNEIFTYDFTTGSRVSVFFCGNGVVSMKIFRKKFIFTGCYDGFVYVLDKTTGCQIGRFPGCGKMILAMDIIGEKLITSSKDNSMQLMDIPKYILALGK